MLQLPCVGLGSSCDECHDRRWNKGANPTLVFTYFLFGCSARIIDHCECLIDATPLLQSQNIGSRVILTVVEVGIDGTERMPGFPLLFACV